MAKKEVKLSDNTLKVLESRYFMDGENWETCTGRVAKVVSEAEKDVGLWRENFHEMIYNMDFLPAGRILRNAGRARGSLFNCYHLPIGDSIEEIGQFYKDALILWSDGGGVGCTFSTLRPKHDIIKGKGGTSSGLVSFMEAANHLADTIESGGSRRAAMLGGCSVEHPEVVDFIDAKTVEGRLEGVNISVIVNGQFLAAVEANKDWQFKFNHKNYGTMPAREIWDKLVVNMVNNAEPGLLNGDNLYKNNSYYYDPVTGTNPCGEAVLEPYGICNLGSLVLPNFITGSVNTNWKKLYNTIKMAVRFLDDVIDVNKYSLKETEIKAHNSRRIGLGVMGLAEYLFAKEIRYGSTKAINEVEKLMRFIRDTVYETMVELASEKGAFPKFDPVAYGKAHFIRTLPASLRMDIKKYGSRCVTGMALAPTGTISMVPEVSGGIEPLFSKGFIKQDRVSTRNYVHPLYEKILTEYGQTPEWFVDSYDLKPEDHFEIQSICQKYVDGAVSKTINMPKGTTKEQLSDLLLEYIHDLKGTTVYVDGSKGMQPLTPMTEDQVKEHLAAKDAITTPTEESVQCASGTCDL